MQRVIDAVERYRQLILDAERYIWKNPETGYKEFKTSKYMEEHFEALGYELFKPDDITGFYTQIDTGKPGPEVLILGELDSVICPAHPEADPETGAVHACGHNAQCATLLGIAAALKEPGVLDGLCGKIRLCAVPAEELLEIGYRTELKKQGKIKYFGGKSEFLSRGYFDGVDIAFMVHTGIGNFAVTNGSIGCIAKRITYKGTASHAGGSPWSGHNALYAATCGINAVNAIRETFRDSNLIRVHPIVTHGGDMVNAIPASVTLESYVRGASFEAIVEANKRVNRALIGAAYSLDTNVEIIDTPGYAPMYDDKNLKDLARDAFYTVAPDTFFEYNEHVSTGSTDMGDLSCIMPTVQPYAPGARGEGHGKTYEIFDPESACVTNAKWQIAMVRLLLENDAARAKRIIAEFEPQFASKEEFLAYVDSINLDGDRIEYCDDDNAKISLR